MAEDVDSGLYLNFVDHHHKIFRLLNLFTFSLLSGAILLSFSSLFYIKKEYSKPVVIAKTTQVDKLNTSEAGKDFQVFFSYIHGSKTFYGNEYRKFYRRQNDLFNIRIDPKTPSYYISAEQLRRNSVRRISLTITIFILSFISFFFNSLPYLKTKRERCS